MSLSIQTDGMQAVTDYIETVGRRAARADIIPLMKAPWGSVVSAEKANIQSETGALSRSLKARAGGGDRPGRFSVYTPATATAKQAAQIWGRSSKPQHKQMAARAMESGFARYRIFYGPWVEKGHRLVRRDAHGFKRQIGMVKPHPFAAPAFDSQAEHAVEQAENAVLDMILG